MTKGIRYSQWLDFWMERKKKLWSMNKKRDGRKDFLIIFKIVTFKDVAF